MTADEKRVSLATRLRDAKPLDSAAARAAVAAVTLMNEAFEASGLSNRRELADALGVTEGRVSQLLNGDGNVRVSTLARVLAATGSGLRLGHDPRADIPLPAPRRREHERTVWTSGRTVTVLETGPDGAGLREHHELHVSTRNPQDEVVGERDRWTARWETSVELEGMMPTATPVAAVPDGASRQEAGHVC